MQLTNAAPPFDIDLFLDELLEMNIRMGDIILKAKCEYKELNANELKDTTIGVIGTNNHDDNNYPFENTLDKKNPIIQLDGQENDSQTFDSEVKKNPTNDKTERSFVGEALDVMGNQWNDWFGREKIKETDEAYSQNNIGAENDGKVPGTVIDDVVVVIDNLNSDGVDEDEVVQTQTYDQSNLNNEGSLNQNWLGTLDSPIGEPNSAAPDNAEADHVEAENAEPDNADPENSEPEHSVSINQVDNNQREEDVDHQEDWGEDTFNNESEDEAEGGWFGNAIDSIVNLFS